MKLTIHKTTIPEVLLLEHGVFEDERGFFMEVYKQDQFHDAGLPDTFVQLNHSRSMKGVLRGLHFQWEPSMGKLMRVTEGAAYLVAVDVRRDSPTLGRWVAETVTESNRLQIWAPAGFARGFCVLSDFAQIQYLCTGVYNSSGESGIRWNDPKIGIPWPITNPTLSAKDERAQTLREWLARAESANFVTNGE
ncbi:MAG: dTDP-4-dehydrorhamnose 3,5-epimerase [Gemmatimonadaceae bacterium]|nr:dTDP-4-dehydrorhamnose 3,5-epimerase [Gemmatimonadaceae bacterium]